MQAPGLRLRVRRTSTRARRSRAAPAKKRVDLGPTIVFDQERCILCRRCVRFCREVPGTGELAVFARGDHSVIETFPGTPLDERLLDERRRHLPGRRAHHQGLPLQDPRLVPGGRAGRLHRLLERLQRAPRRREQPRLPLRAAPQRRGEPDLDLRRGPALLQAHRRRRPHRRTPRVRNARRQPRGRALRERARRGGRAHPRA